MTTFWQRLRDPKHLAFGTPGVLRVFLGCRRCGRVKPHYDLYAPRWNKANPLCRCGHNDFSPRRIPEWQAAFRLLVIGWLWRKTILKKEAWDPRLPIRDLDGILGA